MESPCKLSPIILFLPILLPLIFIGLILLLDFSHRQVNPPMIFVYVLDLATMHCLVEGQGELVL